MKKKRNIIILVMIMIMFTVGCVDKGKDLSETPSALDGAVQPEETDPAAEKEIKSGSLNVENDTFTIEDLVEKIGASESDALLLLGVDKKDSYKTEIFGEDTVVTIFAENDMIETITLTFVNTDVELLINAVSEQIGQDEEKTGDCTKWTCDDIFITLTQADTGCVIEIHK